jgi:NAD(P) transhydrogenase subunit alpha
MHPCWRTAFFPISGERKSRGLPGQRVLPGCLALAIVLLVAAPLWAEPTNGNSSAAQATATDSAASAHKAAPVPHKSDLPTMLFVFMLASFIGLGVITRVSRLLHTPLMSITNAISAIAVVGAITVAGAKHEWYITLLGSIALFASMTNIVSGFLITDRMLKMFKKREPGNP